MTIIALALPILGLLFAGLLLLEVRRFRARRYLISFRRFTLRLIAGGLAIALVAAVFVGLFVLDLDSAASRPYLFLTFWSSCLVAALALIVIMVADLREVGTRSQERRREIVRDFAEFLARRSAAGKPQEPPAPPEAEE